MVLIYGIMLLNYFGILDVEWLTINVITFLFVGIYALAVRHLAGESCECDECDDEPVTLTLRHIVTRFVLAAVVIVVMSILLTYITDDIATKYNLGVGLAGAIFLGVATSLPEVASTIALVRMRNYDIAVGNIVGSNLFNFLVLCTADLFSRGDGGLQCGEHLRQLLDGLEQLADVLGEHVQRADGNDIPQHLGGAAAQNEKLFQGCRLLFSGWGYALRRRATEGGLWKILRCL